MALRGSAGVLHDITVHPGHRGQGVGRLLLDAALAFLGLRGVPRVAPWTAERNEAAQRLFASAAFRRTMIEMTRELAPNKSFRSCRRKRCLPLEGYLVKQSQASGRERDFRSNNSDLTERSSNSCTM